MTNAPTVVPGRRVEMWFAGTSAQNRWTVAFRAILAIPQFIVLYVLFIAFLFVMVIGWFAALFTGRLPEWVHTFLGGVIRWYTRVSAYVFLLTDSYPPFSLADVEYPVRPVLPARGPLNRVSVFFRIILVIPAAVFYEIVLNGLTFPLLFFMWIAVLIRGSLPPALYDAYGAFVRYQARLHSWFSMLTSEYAWGMLGDFVPPLPAASTASPPAASAPPPATPTAPPLTKAPAQPPSAQAPPAQPFAYPVTSGDQLDTPEPEDAPAPPGWPPPQPAPPTGAPAPMPPPSQWERTSTPSPQDQLPPWGILVLQGAARAWMIFAIVWGSIIFVGQNVVRSIGNNNHNNHSMFVQLDEMHPGTSGLTHVIGQVPTDF
jgi:Domain of unknown function (DUF4389)